MGYEVVDLNLLYCKRQLSSVDKSCRDLNFDLCEQSCDTLTSVSKPVRASKDWLISSVRLLSRVYLQKGEGQVWSHACQPEWWDREVGLPWRNPTGQHKDTIDDLKKKYEALARKLREEKRFPAEVNEESRLWDDGKVDELFQLLSEKNLFESLKKLTSACSSHVDKYGLVNTTIRSEILLQVKTLLKFIKDPSPAIDGEAHKIQTSRIALESTISHDVSIHKSTQKCFSNKQRKQKTSFSSTRFKKKLHTPSQRNQTLDLQTEFNPSSSHQANYIFQKSSKSNHSPDYSEKLGSENFLLSAVCSSTNFNKTCLRPAESDVNGMVGIKYPYIGRFSHENLVDVIIPETHKAVVNNFPQRREKEMLRKRKSDSDSVNVSNCKQYCESILRVEPSNSSTFYKDVDLANKDIRREELNISIKENTEILNNNANEDQLSAPKHSAAVERTEEPLLEISEIFTGEEKDILFYGNSMDFSTLFLDLPGVDPSHDLRSLEKM